MESRPPLEFANRVIRMLVDNMFGSHVLIIPSDYTTMRTTFRRLGGLWEDVFKGDLDQCKKIVQVTQAWGKLQNVEGSRKIEVGF